jgi:serine/threonine-protein kinase mTOR
MLLTLIVNATQRLIKPYALPMLRVLLQKANDPNPTVVANVIRCLGELACVAGEDAMPHVPDLMNIIISRLSDPSLVKRDAALHTLGLVCSSTGYVISPLVDHPQLLQLLARILRTEVNQQIRREVVKVLGILGALDPYRRKVCESLVAQSLTCSSGLFQSRPEEDATPETAAVNAVPVTPSTAGMSDDYYQTVVFTTLLSVLKDQALSGHHYTVIEAIMSIFKTQGLKCVTFLPQVAVLIA